MTRASAEPLLPESEELKTSIIAILSLVVGIIGCCLPFFVPGLLALVMGAVALVQINRNSNLIGQPYAVAGVVLGCISIAVSCLVMPNALMSARHTARQMQYMTDMRAVAGAMLEYADANNGQLPMAASWPTDIGPYLDDPARLESPAYPGQGRAMAMNATLSGARLSDIPDAHRTVLLFEVNPGGPTAGGLNQLPERDFGRKAADHGYAIVFVDGRAENVSVFDVEDLIWNAGSANGAMGGGNGPGGGGNNPFIVPE